MPQGLAGMSGLPSFRFSGNKVNPSEIDGRIRYKIENPTVDAAFIGTVEATGATNFVITNIKMDYPRNVLLTITGVAGGMGGTATVYGTDQFGGTQSETIGFASAANGGTKAGTKIFESVASATIDGLSSVGGTGVGTASIGAAIGTAANIVALFGLPVRIAAVSDVKKIMWNDAATMKAVNGGTVTSTYVGTALHTVTHGQIVAAADSIYVDILTTYDNTQQRNAS